MTRDMKSLARLIVVAVSGAGAGWLGSFCFVPSSRPVAAKPSEHLPAPPPVPAFPDWRRWLDAVAVADPPVDAAGFRDLVSTRPTTSSPARRSLALDETLAALPFEQLRLVLGDERFGRLPEVLPTLLGSTRWMGRLLRLPPDQALALCEEFHTPFLRGRLEPQLNDFLSRMDPDLGFSLFRQYGDRINAVAHFLGRVAHTDIAKATAFWHQLDYKPAKNLATKEIMSTLFGKDWQSAMAWAQENLPEESRRHEIGWTFQRLGPNQKDSLLHAASETTDPAMRSLFYSKAITCDTGDPREMVEAALALPPDSLDENGWGALGKACTLRSLAEMDAAASVGQLEALASQLPDSGKAAFMGMAAMIVGSSDPSLCPQLLDYLPGYDAQSMAEQWAQSDPAATSAWLRTLEPSAKRDEAVAGFCRVVATVDPASAAQWALSIQADGPRATAVRDALDAWRQTDPAAAEAWAAAHGLDPPPP